MDQNRVRHDALCALQILDTPRESFYDEVVQLAQIVCETKICLVTLIDTERQWFKASFGFDAAETPISDSVCVHCLGVDDFVEIRDMATDPRTRQNRFVTGRPNLRFYAGAAIRTPGGVKIGALCVLDDKPRLDGLTLEQTEFLIEKAQEISGSLLLRQISRMSADHAVATDPRSPAACSQ